MRCARDRVRPSGRTFVLRVRAAGTGAGLSMGAFGNLAVVDTLIIGAFLLAITVAGYALSRAASKGLDDYFLGGRKIPWWILGVSTSSSNFDMAGTMIIVGLVFALGYQGFLVEMRGGVGIALAFIMVFLAKWLRRSRVMTSAQWMRLRFGTDRQGQAAHLLSAIANIALSLGMIIYFSKGGGKFLTYFLPFSEFTCIVAMVGRRAVLHPDVRAVRRGVHRRHPNGGDDVDVDLHHRLRLRPDADGEPARRVHDPRPVDAHVHGRRSRRSAAARPWRRSSRSSRSACSCGCCARPSRAWAASAATPTSGSSPPGPSARPPWWRWRALYCRRSAGR